MPEPERVAVKEPVLSQTPRDIIFPAKSLMHIPDPAASPSTLNS